MHQEKVKLSILRKNSVKNAPHEKNVFLEIKMSLHSSQKIWSKHAEMAIKRFLRVDHPKALAAYPFELIKLIILFGLTIHHFILNKQSKNYEFSQNNSIVALKTIYRRDQKTIGNFIWDKNSIKKPLYHFLHC